MATIRQAQKAFDEATRQLEYNQRQAATIDEQIEQAAIRLGEAQVEIEQAEALLTKPLSEYVSKYTSHRLGYQYQNKNAQRVHLARQRLESVETSLALLKEQKRLDYWGKEVLEAEGALSVAKVVLEQAQQLATLQEAKKNKALSLKPRTKQWYRVDGLVVFGLPAPKIATIKRHTAGELLGNTIAGWSGDGYIKVEDYTTGFTGYVALQVLKKFAGLIDTLEIWVVEKSKLRDTVGTEIHWADEKPNVIQAKYDFGVAQFLSPAKAPASYFTLEVV